MNKVMLIIFLSTFFFLSHIARADHAYNSKNHPFSLEETTISSIHNAIKSHQLTCEQLINLYLERIKKYNLSPSESAPINSFTEINQNVIEQARQLDDRYSSTQQLVGSLHCIPVVIKDNIDTYDATTTSGSLALLGNQPSQDAFLVTQLRKAGAIILGKGGWMS